MKQLIEFYVILTLCSLMNYGYANSFSCQILNEDEFQECPPINEPVCAVVKKGLVQCEEAQCRFTYQNKCEACKNSKIIEFVIEGPCEDYPKKAVFCNLDRADYLICDNSNTRRKNKSQKVCGFFNLNTKCNLNPCFEEYISNCEACNNELVDFYLNGPCPIQSTFQH